MSGGGGGAGGGLVTDANARLIVEDDVAGAADVATDLRELPLFDFGTDVDPPTITAGTSLGVSWSAPTGLRWGQESYLRSGSLGGDPRVYIGPGPAIAPYIAGTSYWSKNVVSIVGHGPAATVPWTYTPAAWGCGLGFGSIGGWTEWELWVSLTVPAHPPDMAGIAVTVTLDQLSGAATGGVVYIRDAQPTVGRSGIAVATIGAGATSLLIPGYLVPAEGGRLWLGVGPAWQADYDYSDAIRPGNGDAGSCVYDPQPPWNTGVLGSGRLEVSAIGSASWRVYAVTGDAFPALVTLDGEEDPVEGGNTVTDLGLEGSPVSGVSAGAFYVEGPGGRCLAAVGEVEDEDQPRGAWSDPWNVGFRFITDITGSVIDAQASEIVITTTRPGARLVGTVHLGDTDRAAGISVETPEGSTYAAVTVTAGELWAARFDDRSDGWLRGKLWRVLDGEPADWMVEVAVPDETSDVGDRIVLCVRAQDGQTIRVLPPKAIVSATGSWVHERLGVASGATDRFVTSHPFVAGTLGFDIGGSFVPPVREDGAAGWLDYMPTAGMVVWARYLAQ